MYIKPNAFVVKISVSDMLKSRDFYEQVLGFTEDKKYTIDADGKYGQNSYMELNFRHHDNKSSYSLGLYKDIESPFEPLPQNGSVPSFIVDDIEKCVKALEEKNVVFDRNPNHSIININVSDQGYMDKFFFFRDPDNNSLVMRENFGKQPSNPDRK